MPVRLNDVTFYDDDLDAEFRRWREAIERANLWTVGGVATFDEGAAGFSLFIPGREKSTARHAVVLSPGISAAPDADTLGSGQIMLRKRDGVDLTDDVEGTLYINFTVPIPTGTRVTVVPDGKDWTIPGANCPPSGP